ncbi:discoidin domain-containing protein [Nonomuraea diastatica]|uniref:discoidin domain-containing protein n=1 Tax=Nonomuraea diastatica TaxID=1848329 RepID=UPI00140D9A26|nr:discoidin domain-containing protein [Nonomuraea diastatica]
MLAGLLAVPLATPAGAVTDLALGKATSADSSQSGRGPALANDSDTATRWCAADGRTGHWWQVDLGNVATLTGTEVRWEFARTYGYHVSVSTDGSTWAQVADRTANTSTAQVQSDAFTAAARYVRITVTGLAASTWASIADFKVFGTDTGTPPGPEPDPALRSRCTGTSPITCHVDVAPGNYDVTVILGDATSPGVTSVQAEARRTVLPAVSTAAGSYARYSFTLNVRQPEGQPTGQGGTGTPGLDLVFSGSAPKLNGIGLAPASGPVLYLAGDSTVCDQLLAPYTGWGQQLPQYFKLGLSVANYGDSGESSGSFLSNSALFPAMKPLIRSGDTVLIQFGHNDKSTTASAFASNLTSLVTQVRSRGGTPVLVTPPVRRLFAADGTLTSTALHVNSVGVNLPATMRQVAAAQDAPLIDLTAASEALVEGLGPNGSGRLYLPELNDKTHFSSYGANEMARHVLQRMRELNLSPIHYLR